MLMNARSLSAYHAQYDKFLTFVCILSPELAHFPSVGPISSLNFRNNPILNTG